MDSGGAGADAVTVPAKVQLVNRRSSEELLRKFADPDEEKKSTKPRKRIKSCADNKEGEEDNSGGSGGGGGLVERKRLLAPSAKRRSVLLRQLATGRSHLKNKSLVRSIGKTWRRTVEGASRVFIQKHYNRHRRLINFNDAL